MCCFCVVRFSVFHQLISIVFQMHWSIICFKLFYRKLSHANRCIYYFCCNRKQLHVSTYICSKTKTNICCKWFNMAILYSLVHLSIKKIAFITNCHLWELFNRVDRQTTMKFCRPCYLKTLIIHYKVIIR